MLSLLLLFCATFKKVLSLWPVKLRNALECNEGGSTLHSMSFTSVHEHQCRPQIYVDLRHYIFSTPTRMGLFVNCHYWRRRSLNLFGSRPSAPPPRSIWDYWLFSRWIFLFSRRWWGGFESDPARVIEIYMTKAGIFSALSRYVIETYLSI